MEETFQFRFLARPVNTNVLLENQGYSDFTYWSRCWKNNVKLKSCSVGCVLAVRFGNVEKNAWAKRHARKHRLYSSLSAIGGKISQVLGN